MSLLFTTESLVAGTQGSINTRGDGQLSTESDPLPRRAAELCASLALNSPSVPPTNTGPWKGAAGPSLFCIPYTQGQCG